MANIEIKSYNQILGDMVRKIIADTPVNDINVGSVLLTLLEAAASNDYENNTAILNVLELLNIDVIKNNDLDSYASNLGLTRKVAAKSSGFIVVSDSNITKRSTSLYSIKPAPIAGTSKLYVNDITNWNVSGGSVYIGRGTTNFEGPLPYSSITDNGTFFTINLSVLLEKDHLLSESVIDAQGTVDRIISAGSIVKIPSNNISPEIKYSTLRTVVIPAGEVSSDPIPAVAIQAGTSSNAGIGTIVLFENIPFPGATITNSNAFTSGLDMESDDDFRDRIKSYSSSLARGTKDAILSAINNISDETDGKQVQSAVITEPAFIGDPSILYIDDGQGFEPSYDGQSVDLLIRSASGTEEFLQLANYPIPRPQCVNNVEAPFLLLDGMQLKVKVDGIEESVAFSTSDFSNISSVTIYDMVTSINKKSITFKCRLTSDSTRLLLYPLDYRAETIQVVSDQTLLDANNVLKFPINEFSYIKLYQNNKLLKEVEKPASLISTPFPTWDIITSGNLVLSVDDTPEQDRLFLLTDFGVSNFNTLTLNDWVTVFNRKYAGITATATTSGRLILTSNREGSSSSLEVIGGTFLEKMFGGQPTYATGQNSDFILNRQNGNLQIKTTISAGDAISAGSSDTRGSITSNSASGGNFNVATDANGRPSEVVMVVDGSRVLPRYLNLPIGSTITISDQGSNTMRVLSSVASSFKNIQPGDFVYITNRGDLLTTGSWVAKDSCGLFKVELKGEHLDEGVDTYIEVKNYNIAAGGPYSVQDALDIQSFFSDVYPQIWRGLYTATPVAASIQDVIASINQNIKGIEASVFRTNYIRLVSSTEEGGSIAIPISVGAASQVFTTGQGNQDGTQSHIANVIPEKDSFTMFKRTSPTSDNVWLDRHIYSELKGSLTSNATPSTDGTGTYSETLTDTATVDFQADVDYDDCISITSGPNKSQIRDIRSIIDSSNVGTRHNAPRTLLDYSVGDEYQVVKNLEISSDDNLVAILDKDSVAKTIDISFSRTGRVNSGSQSATFIPTNLAFSANDNDNETGVDFGSLGVWGTLASQSNTNFNDYAVWFKARNWYSDNGAALIIRAKEYGPIGDKLRFSTGYPSVPSSSGVLTQSTTPDHTTLTYTFGSGAAVNTDVAAGDQFTLTNLGSNVFRMTFPSTATVNNASVNNLITLGTFSGFSSANIGTFSILAKNDTNKTIDIYNPNGVATVVGNPTVQTVTCVADVTDSLDGKYFVLTDYQGDTVKFWYDNNDAGTVEPAIGTTTRSWEINVATDDSAIAVATATAAAILNDSAFSTATNLSGTSSIITITSANNGPSAVGMNGSASPGFSFLINTAGVLDTYESLNVVSQLQIYPIADNSTSTIAAAINSSSMLEAAEKISGTLYKATKDITGVTVNTVGYDHDPSPLSGKNSYISLWDSKNWVLSFQNSNPNFQLKNTMILSGVSALYQLDTTINVDGTQGELFKLVPATLTNLKHHVTHKALSQLDIVSDLAFASNNKKLQIKSQQLGSGGAIEVVGGRANSAKFKIIGDSQVVSTGGSDYLEVKIPAAPNTLAPGQHVLIGNDSGVERLNRMISTDTMDVVKFGDGVYDYRYNTKDTNFSQYTRFTIADANGIDPVSYPNAGLVWRWTHDDSGSYVNITDKISGAALDPKLYSSSGVLGGSTNLHLTIGTSGTLTTKLCTWSLNSTTIQCPSGVTGLLVGSTVSAVGIPVGATIQSLGTNAFTISLQTTTTQSLPTGVNITTLLDFSLTSSGQPAQGDYVRFENSSGSTWAAWFSVDGDLTAPVGATFTTATNKVRVDILSSNSPNEIISQLVSSLLLNSISSSFDIDQTAGASLSDVREGNIVNVLGPSSGWDSTNLTSESGSGDLAGSTIVKVDASNKYIDVVNPNGKAMPSTQIGACDVIISSTPIIEWKLAHSARTKIIMIDLQGGVATVTTDGPHNLNVGDTFTAVDIPSAVAPTANIVVSVLGPSQFTYASALPNSNKAPAGLLIKTGRSRTRYKIESLGYNSMFRISRFDGDSPKFISCGAAVDDLLLLGGTTFGSINNGEFRILALDENSIVYQNPNGVEKLNTFVLFNNYNIEPTWVANSDVVTGVAGTFAHVQVGDWVKKITDDDTAFVQVKSLNLSSELATVLTLASPYTGVSGTAPSHSLDQNSSINTGVFLEDIRDVRILEGDSARIGDSIFITENISASWFEEVNSGQFTISDLGTLEADGRIYLRVENAVGTEESNVSMGVLNTRFSITENTDDAMTSIKQIHHIAIDDFNPNRRIVYLSPGNRSYKWNQTNSTYISAIGKIGYSEVLTSGIDGYQYYTGLLRKVQRVVDGFEPDAASFPGRKAVGSAIEILPPLPVRVSVALDVTTQGGVNLSEISDQIVSTVINYVSDLGVGEDVILSDIIVRVKGISGVAAVTFITPGPSNERISISDSEKAFIEPTDISVT